MNVGAGKAASGTVTGHVLLDDTKGPAHNATVHLQPAAELEADAPSGQTAGRESGSVTVGVQARLDGSFAFSHIAAGHYYVIASCPGYISPNTLLSLAEERSGYGDWRPLDLAHAAAKKRILAALPRVTAQPGVPAAIDATLDRGAAISGAVTYDDGTPAAGLRVSALARMTENGKETWAEFNTRPHGQGESVFTDDRGNYRIAGLPARAYIVRVDASRTLPRVEAAPPIQEGAPISSVSTPAARRASRTPRR
jgi:5-hydroxyisourate hydrolase-like protein (transthyretin family)